MPEFCKDVKLQLCIQLCESVYFLPADF
uniref:Uncharacterized protein n=1 Tax=Arundo donax TaxID=35708 RepID=A0A0A9AZ83_ARUDO